MTGAEWRAKKNERALARLRRSLPEVFPVVVLQHALSRPLIPPMPRLAIDGYWRAHPLRADRLARALASRTGPPPGWSWRLGEKGLPASFRTPPAPFREARFSTGPGQCCVCGQPVYRFGWHQDLWQVGLNRNATWHSSCVVAWRLWTAPSEFTRLLRKVQAGRCASTGRRLARGADVDHRVPLFAVWRDYRDLHWPELLAFWGLPNLQVINPEEHTAKCALEATQRAAIARPVQGRESTA